MFFGRGEQLGWKPRGTTDWKAVGRTGWKPGLRLFRVGFDEIDAGADLGDAVIPVVLMFDGDMPIKFLLFKLFQTSCDIDYARARDDDRGFTEGGFVLHMHADDAAIQNPQAFDRLQVGGTPVPEVRAGSDAFVAALYDSTDVERVPDLVFRIAHGAAMLMEGDLDIKFDGRSFPCGHLFGRFRADGVKFHFFGKCHDGPDFLGIVSTYHSIVHGADSLTGALGFEFGHGFGGHGVAYFFGGTGFEELAREKLDEIAARLLGFCDGLKGAEAVEGVGLRSNEPAVLAEAIGDRGGEQASGEGECEEREKTVGFHGMVKDAEAVSGFA